MLQGELYLAPISKNPQVRIITVAGLLNQLITIAERLGRWDWNGHLGNVSTFTPFPLRIA
jgi:hypothetical protein